MAAITKTDSLILNVHSAPIYIDDSRVIMRRKGLDRNVSKYFLGEILIPILPDI